MADPAVNLSEEVPPKLKRRTIFGLPLGRRRTTEPGNRSIRLNESNYVYPDNAISTTKYNLITFLPKNLFEQFRRAANCWFLLVTLLQLIPDVSPTSPWTSIIPLAFVLSVTGLKEFVEDWKRRKSDIQINNHQVQMMKNGNVTNSRWKDIRVGDIILLNNNQQVPADLIALSSSNPDGMVYLETAAIDGETNLKPVQCLPQTQARQQDYANFEGKIICESPTIYLYRFLGNLQMNGETYPLSNKQFLYRGATIKNTDWVYGVTVHTGRDTKLIKNSRATPSKYSSLEKSVNRAIYQLFVYIILISFVCAILSTIWISVNGSDMYRYLRADSEKFLWFIKAFITFIILYHVMIPISLYVTMELCKVALSLFINQDLKMYHSESDTPAKARTSNLHEQLGQLEYVFSDKTGTLTANVMEFQACSIAGVSYGTQKTKGEPQVQGSGNEDDQVFEKKMFDPTDLLQNLDKHPTADQIRHFLLVLAVAHTVAIERDDEGNTKYSATSPDEAALVQAAKDMGFTYKGARDNKYILDVNGVEESYDVLAVHEFSSDRKRMSIIVRFPNGQVKMLIKGADNVIKQRLARGQDDLVATTDQHLLEFAQQGLRTLFIGYKDFSDEEFAKYQEQYQAAAQDLANRDQRLNDLADEMEQDIVLLGGTGIEDKLQDGVPECIETLLRANLKVWVLTGDKEETAVNIAGSCKLLTPDMKTMTLNSTRCPDVDSLKGELTAGINAAQNDDEDAKRALVIDGATMDKIFGNPDLEKELFTLASKCKAVVCCRSSPKQKELVVNLVKTHDHAQTLAIGDGANDVPMIQAAHVGVGISGKEGMQAVNSSDYAIAQFRFLERLILIHGRWGYKRLAKLFVYFFFKTMAMSMTQFWFQWFCGFSGQTIYDSWAIAFYNTLFTAAPIFIFAVFERDVPERKIQQYPELYETGQLKQEFNTPLFYSWILLAIYQSLIIFYLVFYIFVDEIMHQNGTTYGLFSSGHTAYTCLVLVVNLVLFLEYYSWTWLHWLAAVLSVLSWYVFALIYQNIAVEMNEMYYLTIPLFSTPTYWLAVLVTVFVCIWPWLSYRVIKRNYFPQNFHIIQEEASIEGKDKYLNSKPNERQSEKRNTDSAKQKAEDDK